MSGNDALQMKKKDVKTSRKLFRSRLESPVVDPSRFIEECPCVLTGEFVCGTYNDCTIAVELYKQRHVGMGRLQ